MALAPLCVPSSEHILFKQNTFCLSRTHSIYAEHILSIQNTFYLFRRHSIDLTDGIGAFVRAISSRSLLLYSCSRSLLLYSSSRSLLLKRPD